VINSFDVDRWVNRIADAIRYHGDQRVRAEKIYANQQQRERYQEETGTLRFEEAEVPYPDAEVD
jgi:hypothetical protein